MESMKKPTHTDDELLTINEVARDLRVDDTTVLRWIEAGALEAVPFPGRSKWDKYRIKGSVVNALLSDDKGEH